jgi:cell division protein FtsB
MARTAERARAPARPGPAPLAQRRLYRMVAVAIVGFLVFFPAKQLVEQRVRMYRLENRLAALREENAALEREVATLGDPDELELHARERLGLTRPGERVFVLVPQPTPVATTPEPVERRPWWARAGDAVARLVRGSG